MILSKQTLRARLAEGLLTPWQEQTTLMAPYFDGGLMTLTGGLGPCGYDIHLGADVVIGADSVETYFGANPISAMFALGASRERFQMPDDLMARVCDKSTWARRGLFVQNTVIEPGWTGYLTLELTAHWTHQVRLMAGTPIAQVIFEQLDEPTEAPYRGKYQDQEAGPQAAR